MLASSSARWHNDGSISLVARGVHTREEMPDDGSAVSQMLAQQWRSFSRGQRCVHERGTIVSQIVAQ